MKLTVHTTPPPPPPVPQRTFTFELSELEAGYLLAIMGHIGGVGPTRDFSSTLYMKLTAAHVESVGNVDFKSGNTSIYFRDPAVAA